MPATDAARSGPVRAHKVLNNNAVAVIDANGRERVLMGRGVGYQLKAGGPVDTAKVEKTFVLDERADAAHVEHILAEVPYPVVQAVARAVEGAEAALGRELGRSLPIAVIDHVQFVLERLSKGLRIPSALMPELRVLYPEEATAATGMAASIGTALGVDLPEDEPVFLTLHLLNATRDEPNGTAAALFRRIQSVVAVVEGHYGITLDTASADYARFILHLKFLLQRLVSEKMLRSTDSSFYDFATRRYPAASACAHRVRSHVLATSDQALTEEEMLYLIVHIERLTAGTGGGR